MLSVSDSREPRTISIVLLILSIAATHAITHTKGGKSAIEAVLGISNIRRVISRLYIYIHAWIHTYTHEKSTYRNKYVCGTKKIRL